MGGLYLFVFYIIKEAQKTNYKQRKYVEEKVTDTITWENTMCVQYKIFYVDHLNIPTTDRGVYEFLDYHTVQEMAVNDIMSAQNSPS